MSESHEPETPPLAVHSTASRIRSLIAVGQTARALELAMESVAASPDEAGPHVSLSRVLSALDRVEEAAAAAGEAVRLDPGNDEALAQRAVCFYRLGRFREAELDVLEAIRIEPDAPWYHSLYARMLSGCGKSREALAAVENALRLDPDDSDAHALRGRLLLRVHPRKWQVSEESILRAIRLDPDDSDAYAALASIRLRQGDRDEAERLYRTALELDPTNRIAIHGLADALAAANWFYRPFLAYSNMLERMGVAGQIGVIAGLWAIVSAILGILAGREGAESTRTAIQYGYLAFCAYTWFAETIAMAILKRNYPWLRRVM